MRALRWCCPALLAFLLLATLLSLREQDHFENGSPIEPRDAGVPLDDPLLRRILPPEFIHACPACGECTHPIQVIDARRTMWVVDHDGWYKLFWAGDDRYYYTDASFLAATLLDPAAGPVQGSWKVRARLGPPSHGAVTRHDCSPSVLEVSLDYELAVSERDIPERPSTASPVPVLEAATMLVRNYDVPHLPPQLRFVWRLAAPPVAVPGPCPCGK